MIDLNKPGSLTAEAVAKLLASKDDSAPRQLRVLENGEVVLSDDVGSANLHGVKFWFETWSGKDYCGPTAAADPKWVDDVPVRPGEALAPRYDRLHRFLTGGMTDIYADADPRFMEATRKAIQKLFMEVVGQPKRLVDGAGIEPATFPV